MTRKKKIRLTIILIIAAFLVFLCFVHITLPRSGLVLDAETGKPVDKAVVCYYWPRVLFLQGRFGGKVYETTTNANGKYFVPPQFIRRTLPFVLMGYETLLIYKDGYAACLDGQSFYGDKSEPQIIGNIVKLHSWKEGVKTHLQHLRFMDFTYGTTNDLLDKELDNEYRRQP
jgi:hypothetical protein